MAKGNGFIDQVRRNQVALISLVVAVAGLSYNTWRNEVSEENRTQRAVAIEVLKELADLQEITWQLHYGENSKTEVAARRRSGWTIAITVRDIATVLKAPLPGLSQQLWLTWQEHNESLSDSGASNDAIIHAIEMCRIDTLALLEELD